MGDAGRGHGRERGHRRAVRCPRLLRPGAGAQVRRARRRPRPGPPAGAARCRPAAALAAGASLCAPHRPRSRRSAPLRTSPPRSPRRCGSMRGCGGRRVLLALLALLLPAAAAGPATGSGPAAAGESPGNFMEDEQWLSSISQYGGRIKHWNRFRDDDYIKSWEDSQPGDEALDTTKDPCQKVKCSRHKVCVAQGYQRAMCISRKKLEHRIKPLSAKGHGGCKPCHAAPLSAVCGSDGHTYSSACKLEQQACLASKQLTVRCEGQCPCPTPHVPAGDGKQEPCTGQDLADLGDRLRDWFQLLQENAKQNGSGGLPASPATALERSVAASCKEAVGWMFTRLDTSGDLFLEAAELAAINLDKYEVCIRAFFNSCDTSRDGRVSAPEWCFCFWREKPPCLRELEKIQIQEAAKKKPGTFIPSCDEDGYYRRAQCEPGGGECWCVDPHGAELTGTRLHGTPDCEEATTGFSGDFGSSVGWEDEEEKEPEEVGEEGEEEEGEAGEGDDGGYIW
ncbi:testican-2 isoform X2 [Heliangelus exortis]|uniref:testican-2 isoform X2 n=1 Tax=Heliangelus exortis TaxID=472823 RepID=UPI003A91612D